MRQRHSGGSAAGAQLYYGSATVPISQTGEIARHPIDEPAFRPLLSAAMKTALILVGWRVGKAV